MIENYKTLNCTKGKFPVKLSFFWKICSLLPKKILNRKIHFLCSFSDRVQGQKLVQSYTKDLRER